MAQYDLFGGNLAIENPDYLRTQIITYIGNKRALLPFIEKGINTAKRVLGRDKITFLDLFSGTGVVARMAKKHANRIVVNDLETYSRINNECYMSNSSELNFDELRHWLNHIETYVKQNWKPGFITELYAPTDESNITASDRVFYTRKNATYIDVSRQAIATIPQEFQACFLGPLLTQASAHANTSGVFKGFYKNRKGIGQFGGNGRNALKRILKKIEITLPILSNFECSYKVYQSDANYLVHHLDEVDIAYFDPPYNQHPYGSNYFMLNLICDYERPVAVSRVSGIPTGWNRSEYNQHRNAERALFDAVENCRSKFILISYNSEGFIPHERFLSELERCGEVSVMDTRYNTFRGCRNLQDRDIHVTEFLYLLDKRRKHGEKTRSASPASEHCH